MKDSGTKVYTVPVQYDEATAEHLIELPIEMLEELGWIVGDTVVWSDNKDGSWTISRKK